MFIQDEATKTCELNKRLPIIRFAGNAHTRSSLLHFVVIYMKFHFKKGRRSKRVFFSFIVCYFCYFSGVHSTVAFIGSGVDVALFHEMCSPA